MNDKKDNMNPTWSQMSEQEKKEMMESFFSDMKGNEKYKFIHDLMGGDSMKGFNPMKMMGMMGKMMGGKGHKMGMGKKGHKRGCHPGEKMEDGDKGEGFDPMEMCAQMMGDGEKGEGFNMMEMCGRMMSKKHKGHKVSTLATPEVQGLFEDWAEQIEAEVLESFKNKEDIKIDEVAAQFKISKDSAYYFLTRLAQKGKINLKFDKEDQT